MDEFVTLRSFGSSIDFEMAKSYLESCGIECFGRDENINNAYFNNVCGGVKLDVRSEQAKEAIQLLVEKGYLIAADFEPTTEIKWLEKVLKYITK